MPVYNSEETLAELYERLCTVFKELAVEFEIILVDDYSRDDSFKVMQNLRRQDKRVKIIKLSFNHGQHVATLCGLSYSQGEFMVTMDDDLQHPPEEIRLLLNEIKNGHDVVFGVSIIKAQGIIKNLGSYIIDQTLNRISNKAPNLKVSSFRLIKRELAEKMIAHMHPGVYLAALILDNAKSPSMAIVKHEPRSRGQSNYNLVKSMRLAANLWLNHNPSAGVKPKLAFIIETMDI